MKYSIFILVISCLFSCFELKNQNSEKVNYHFENAESVLPKPIGLVNDYFYIFTAEEKMKL